MKRNRLVHCAEKEPAKEPQCCWSLRQCQAIEHTLCRNRPWGSLIDVKCLYLWKQLFPLKNHSQWPLESFWRGQAKSWGLLSVCKRCKHVLMGEMYLCVFDTRARVANAECECEWDIKNRGECSLWGGFWQQVLSELLPRYCIYETAINFMLLVPLHRTTNCLNGQRYIIIAI